jgi:drug/metabolite transporter (DMT)-like permease
MPAVDGAPRRRYESRPLFHLPDTPPGPALTRVLVALLCLIWGSTWLVIQEGLDDLPPLTSAGVRFALAFAVMAFVAPRLARREGGGAPPTRLWLLIGTLNFAASYAIVYVTETVLPSGLVAVLWAVFPLMAAVPGHFVLGERLGVRQLTGLLLGFVGTCLLFGTDIADFEAGEGGLLGPLGAALLLLVSPLVSVVGQTCMKLWGTRSSSALLNRNAMGLGAALLLGLAFAFERDAAPRWTPAAIGSIVYLAVVGTCLTFTLYYWLLRYAEVTRLSVITYVTPIVALLLGWAVRGEAFTAGTAASAALVLLGVALVGTKSRAATPRRRD